MPYIKTLSIFDNFLSWDVSGEVISSVICMLVVIIFYVIIGIIARHHDPLKKPKGLLLLGEMLVNFFDGLVRDLMGPGFEGFGGYFLAVGSYLFMSFIWSLTGLPSPITYMAVPLSVSLLTFILIHATSIRFTKWKYFKRYVEPFPVFLPINLISMWAPLLSLTLRLFGNAIAGWVIMSLVYGSLEGVSQSIFTMLPEALQGSMIAPIVTPVLHAYFDFFSGFIQTTVFLFLSMILIAQEKPEEEIVDELNFRRGGNEA